MATTKGEKAMQTYTLNQYDKQHGKVINGIFHKPIFAVYRNSKMMELNGGQTSAYKDYATAFHIMLHLQAVSKDDFQVLPVSWQPMNDYQIIDPDDMTVNSSTIQ